MKKILLPVLLLLGALSASAQTSSLVSIRNSKGHGSGICLDTPCQHVITARHLIEQFGKLKVEGVAATATIAGGNRDLMLLTLERPLSRFVAVKLSDEDAKKDQDIISISDFLGKYHQYTGKVTLADYKSILFNVADGPGTVTGQYGDYFMMDYHPVKGDSGGAVFKSGKLIGLLIAQIMDKPNGKVTGAVALSVKVIKQWLRDGDAPEAVTFAQRKTLQPNNILDRPPILDSADPVTLIQEMSVIARRDAESVQKVYATQLTDFQLDDLTGVNGAKAGLLQYQIEGYGTTPVYREIHNGKLGKEKIGFSVPGSAIVPGTTWHFLLASIADQNPITYRGLSSLDQIPVRVFYKAANPCAFAIDGESVSGLCDDEIITDYNLRILAISRNISLPVGLRFSDIQIVFRYKEVAFNGLDSLLLPASAAMKGAGSGGLYSSQTRWVDYKRYTSAIEIDK